MKPIPAYTITEAALAIGWPRTTLQTYIDRGEVRTTTTAGNTLALVPAAEVERLRGSSRPPRGAPRRLPRPA